MDLGNGVEKARARHQSRAARETGLRVLTVAPTSFFSDYGCHVRILEESRALARLGAQIEICTYPGGRDIPNLTIHRAPGGRWGNDVRVGSSYHRVYLDGLLTAHVALRIVESAPAIVHAHLHEGALIAWLTARPARIPVVFDFQGSLTSEMVDHGFLATESPMFRPLRRFERWLDHTAEAVLTSSHNAASILIDQFGVPRDRVHAVPDAVNAAEFVPWWTVPEHLRFDGRQELRIPPGRQVVGYLGLLAEYQGIGHLLRAAAALVARRDDLHFLLMGYPGHERYRDYAAQLGIGDHVTFTGRIPYECAPELLALLDIAVSPKLSETEGNGKLLNYMSVGLPTVAFDGPVGREILGDGGRFAAHGDEASLAREMAALLDSPQRRAIGEALRARAISHFSWDAAGQAILDVYQRLLDRSNRARGHAI
ncbi:MAG: glycosyltransferase family 1 protein [Chloroflexota bacterium]|nr:MAG: glycosyltransferase family 1 protein [Chloroflexota bacterium]